MLFPLPGREIVTVSCREPSWIVIDSNCSYVSPENAKKISAQLDPLAHATLDPVAPIIFPAFRCLALKIQPCDFPELDRFLRGGFGFDLARD
jgi:hypothetical protein